ncbi:hypothetical protein DVH24_014297 [Malus domestica]|uniref:Uncharacterized protein n=1 Tax=Malus domestica TaxID=3750 RepID=A0A498JK67_MALDO|nr:hypothetical protein DVH24_014297 [Malus domestica]
MARANKGIGLGVVKQLASNGFTMVLTARDEKRDLEAVEKPKDYAGVAAAQVIFHQLEVAKPCYQYSLKCISGNSMFWYDQSPYLHKNLNPPPTV